jgi:hypothetical protein
MEEENPSTKINTILENAKQNIGYYNYLIASMFSDMNSFNAKPLDNKVMANFVNNVHILCQHIYDLNEKKKENYDLYKCLSCIYGAFLGDALGGYCEFKPASLDNIKYIFYGNPIFGDSPGQVTDDSEMAMSSAFGIMDNPDLNDLDSDYLYYYYGCWYLSHPRDIGFTTRNALRMFNPGAFNPNTKNNYINNFYHIINTNNNSLANGFLMRTSPFIVWCYYRYKDLILEAFEDEGNDKKLFDLFSIIKIQARKDNICTHPNESICIAHSCFTIMGLAAIRGKNAKEILNYEEKLLRNEYFDKHNLAKNVKAMIIGELNEYRKEESDEGLTQAEKGYKYFTSPNKSVNKQMGFYVHGFRLTLYYLYHFDDVKEDKANNYTKYRVIMNQICSYGGDTDTNAAIAGAVLGPLIGYKNFGDEFKIMVELVPHNRYIFTPALMILYVYFLKNSNKDKKIKTRMNFLRMILKVLFERIDVNQLEERERILELLYSLCFEKNNN